MTEPERIAVQAPSLFDAFRERRTRGQRVRAAMDRVYTAVHRVRRSVGRA